MGLFACDTQVTQQLENGAAGFGGIGMSQMLRLTQVGGEVTAEYSGDSFIDGTLRFTATTDTTAIAEPGQSLSAYCLVYTGTDGGTETLQTLNLASSSIAVVGPTVLISFAGEMAPGSACAGTPTAGSLVCVSAAMK